MGQWQLHTHICTYTSSHAHHVDNHYLMCDKLRAVETFHLWPNSVQLFVSSNNWRHSAKRREWRQSKYQFSRAECALSQVKLFRISIPLFLSLSPCSSAKKYASYHCLEIALSQIFSTQFEVQQKVLSGECTTSRYPGL